MDTDRRRLLELSGLALATALAGCATGGGQTTVPESTSPAGTTATDGTTASDGTTTTEEPTTTERTTTETTTEEPTTTERTTTETTTEEPTTTERATTETTTEEPTKTERTTTAEPTTASGETVGVTVASNGDLRFSPGTVRIAVGDTVEWEWAASGHNIVVDSQPAGADWGGTEGGPGTTYGAGHEHSHTFTVAGRYEYYCSPHQSLGMVGSVVVE